MRPGRRRRFSSSVHAITGVDMYRNVHSFGYQSHLASDLAQHQEASSHVESRGQVHAVSSQHAALASIQKISITAPVEVHLTLIKCRNSWMSQGFAKLGRTQLFQEKKRNRLGHVLPVRRVLPPALQSCESSLRHDVVESTHLAQICHIRRRRKRLYPSKLLQKRCRWRYALQKRLVRTARRHLLLLRVCNTGSGAGTSVGTANQRGALRVLPRLGSKLRCLSCKFPFASRHWCSVSCGFRKRPTAKAGRYRYETPSVSAIVR
jgi:hypothetical protein